jgi:hypothetical protein
LGLKHVPIPSETSNNELELSLKVFKHKIGWNYLFHQNNSKDLEYQPKFKTILKPFHFCGKYQKPLEIIQETIDKVGEYQKHSPISCIKSKQMKRIHHLKADPSLFWTPSDKNLGLVCLNTIDYHRMVMEHLNQDIYTDIGTVVTKFFDKNYQQTKNQFISLVQNTMIPIEKENNNLQLLKYLKEQLKKAKNDEYEYPAFHILPKIHKGLENLKSRPIVGAVNWFSTSVSKILSFHLQKCLQTYDQSHLLRRTSDTIDRLNQIKRTDITKNPILVTLDIENLYTNILLEPLEEILEYLNPYFKSLCKFINRNNKFVYMDQIYHQTNGIAMGTNSAPEMANLYLLTLLDTQILACDNIKSYSRYLDDIFFIWNDNEEELILLISKLQLMIPGIRFSYKYSRKKVAFLDLNIIVDNNNIQFFTHQKLMNQYSYITPLSCHPLHTFKGWIIAELNRYKTNSSRRIYYQHTKELFYQRLLDRGYPRKYLTPIFDKHYYVFPSKQPKENKIVIPLIVRYSKRSRLKTLSKIVHENVKLQHMLPNHRFLVCWKRSKSIRDLLCSSKLSVDQVSIVKKNFQACINAE